MTYEKINYYTVIGKMAHTIEYGRIELRGSVLVKENTLRQFSDLFDEAIIKAEMQIINELEKFIPDDSSYWNEHRGDILKRVQMQKSKTLRTKPEVLLK